MNWPRSPGLWLFVAAVEMLLLVHVSEFLYPGYSVSQDFISELGVGPTASRVVFATALVLFGLMTLWASYLLREKAGKSWLWLMLAISGVGAIGVGVFDMDNFMALHGLFALLAFLFGNVAAIYSWKEVRPPVSYLFVALGVIGLAALVLLIGSTYLGLGQGGMERLVFYPAMFWVMSFGMYTLAEENATSRA